MKKAIWGILLLAILMVSTVSVANDNQNDWNHHKDIVIQGENKYKYFYLDSDVYKYSNSDLSDIRIVNENGQFVPYYLSNYMTQPQTQNVSYNSNFEAKFTKQHDTYFDFRIQPLSENTDVLGNRLLLQTDAKNFLKNADIYGSHDNIKWDFLQSEDIYNINNVSKLNINLTNTFKYQYYRIKIKNNLENINISDLHLLYEHTAVNVSDFKENKQANYEIINDNKTTLINIKNEFRLKITNVAFSINGNFSRHYEVFVKENENYRSLGYTGDIYNFEYQDRKLSNVTIKFNYPITYTDIQVRINNLDDKPLDIKGLSQEYMLDKLVFEADKNNTYKVYFGNAKAARPQYDIENQKGYIENERQDLCKLLNLTSQNLKTGVQQTFNVKKVYNIVLVVLSVALISIILVKLKSKSEK